MKCSVDSCENQSNSRGLCMTHYSRLRRRGELEPLDGRRVGWDNFVTRLAFGPRFDPAAPMPWQLSIVGTYCLDDTSSVRTQGGAYAKFQKTLSHRWLYVRWFGPIPDDHDLDHLCLRTPCVNPIHLEPVTRAENSRRRQAVSRLVTLDDVVVALGARFTPAELDVLVGRLGRKVMSEQALLNTVDARLS